MSRRPQGSRPSDTLTPYTTRFRSGTVPAGRIVGHIDHAFGSRRRLHHGSGHAVSSGHGNASGGWHFPVPDLVRDHGDDDGAQSHYQGGGPGAGPAAVERQVPRGTGLSTHVGEVKAGILGEVSRKEEKRDE